MKRVSDAYYENAWDEFHDCNERRDHHARDLELGSGLGVYPQDVTIFKTNGEWWEMVEEYYVPIKFCPFCGKRL